MLPFPFRFNHSILRFRFRFRFLHSSFLKQRLRPKCDRDVNCMLCIIVKTTLTHHLSKLKTTPHAPSIASPPFRAYALATLASLRLTNPKHHIVDACNRPLAGHREGLTVKLQLNGLSKRACWVWRYHMYYAFRLTNRFSTSISLPSSTSTHQSLLAARSGRSHDGDFWSIYVHGMSQTSRQR